MRWALVVSASICVYVVILSLVDNTTSVEIASAGRLEEIRTTEGPEGSQPRGLWAVSKQEPDNSFSEVGSMSVANRQSAVKVGEPLDPEDSSNWPGYRDYDPVVMGEPLDPEDSSNWPGYQNIEPVVLGNPLDPEDASTWPDYQNVEPVVLGEPLDPDDSSNWPNYFDGEPVVLG